MKTNSWHTVLAVVVLAGCVAFAGVRLTQAMDDEAKETKMTTQTTVSIHVFDDQGELVGPVHSPKVVKTEKQWKAQLTPEQFRILRKEGTEAAFCGTLLDNKVEGVYTCAGCGLPLYASDTKFKSGTGWPSFFQPIAPGNITEKRDGRFGMVRIEIQCARCDGHLGHVFNDGPAPTGMRHCLNSESLLFTPNDQLATLADPAAYRPTTTDGLASAVFAGGCFWCTEAVFEPVEGVSEVISGYAGGMKDDASYERVSSGSTRHAEAIKIIYDPAKASYAQLLELFFHVAHDPTQLNRQGNDIGTQYRSAVFYSDEQQKLATQAYIKTLDESGQFDKPIATTLEPLTEFYPAEHYHQDYVRLNPTQPYVQHVALPKVEKLHKKYGDLLKKDNTTSTRSDNE